MSNLKGIHTTLISAGISFCFLLALPGEDNGSTTERVDKRHESVEGKIPLKDRMDLAIQHEFEITRDPATNTVPKERLIEAYRYTRALQESASHRAAGAITGVTWLERGPDNVGGRTRAIMVDPNDATGNTIWSAGVGGGLWKTTDITASSPDWQPIDDLFNNLAITALAYDPGNTQTMYFGTGEGFYNADAIRGNGIWKSTNGGTTWTQLAATASSGNFNYIQKIVVHPTTGDVYAGTRSGVFRSQNGGTSWSKVLGSGAGASSNRVSDLEIGADNAIYAALGLFQTDGVYKSVTGNNGGWTKLNTGGNGFPTTGFSRIEIACAPSNANVIYAVTQQNPGYGAGALYHSTNGGATWTARSTPTDADPGIGSDFTRSQAWYDLTLAVDPNNQNRIFVGGIDIFKSTNSGSSWQQICHWYGGFGYQEVHADQHAIVFEPGSSDIVYFGNDGGIYRTANGTASVPTIAHKSDNYNVTQYYACAMSPLAYSSEFIAGAQDNGSQKYNSLGINSTVEVTGGDGCFTHIDQTQPQYQFTSYVYNNIYRSTNNGASFTRITNNNTGAFVNPSDYDDLSNNLYSRRNGGSYYVLLNAHTNNTQYTRNIAAFNGASVTHVSVSPNFANRVYFGLTNGDIVRVDNAQTNSPTSVNITGGSMPNGTVSCIAIEDGNDNHLLVTYSNYGVNSVWETTNGGTNWISVEGNIPDMPVRWALFNPNNSDQAMLATELGAWTTDDLNGTSTIWGPSNTGMANVRTDMLQIRDSDKLVIAATHGRGLFSTDAFTDPYAEFVSDRQITYTGKPITFTDVSYKSGSWSWNFGDGNTSVSKNPVHTYNNPGLYTVSLQINGSGSLTRTKTGYIQVLPDRGTPYLPSNGGDFDVNALDFGAETVSGTAFERGSSAIGGKNGTNSGSNAWVTGLTAGNYSNNTDTRLMTPSYNLTLPGTYTLRFYRKNVFEIGWDGMRVEYSLNKGDSWTALGAVGANWYDFNNNANTTAFPLGEPYFNGTRSSFSLCEYDISALSGNPSVAFRIRFKSDTWVTSAGVAIDDFQILGQTNNPLPVELVEFSGTPETDHNRLVWSTLSEINSDRFELQRASDGISFEKIGEVKGAGNSISLLNYEFRDTDVVPGEMYYRLRIIDIDGSYEYSGTIAISRSDLNDGLVKYVYPNPFLDELNIVMNRSSVPVNVKLYDLSGKMVIDRTVGSTDGINSFRVPTSGLSEGVYLIQVTDGRNNFVDKLNRR